MKQTTDNRDHEPTTTLNKRQINTFVDGEAVRAVPPKPQHSSELLDASRIAGPSASDVGM